MDEIFKIYNSIYPSYKDPQELIEKLFNFFAPDIRLNDARDELLYKSLQTNENVDQIKVFQLLGLVHQKKKESEKIINTDKRKHFGIYYTDYDIARLITKESLSNTKDKDLLGLKFYEPCVGGGIFVISYVDEVLSRVTKSAKSVQKLIDNIYFSDIDDEIIEILVKLLPLYIKSKYGVAIKIAENNYFRGDVLFGKDGEQIVKIDPKNIFGVENGFDIILTNPPYKLLKANSNKYQDELNENKYALDIKEVIKFIRQNKIYKFNQGTLNYYKIFLEEILENYTSPTGKIGAIIPVTLLNDKQSEYLRKRIINTYKLFKLYIIPEKNDFFPDISQAFCFFALDKTEPGEIIKINSKVANVNDFKKECVEVQIKHMKKVSASTPIVIENETGWKILKKLNKLPKLSSLTSVCNARGELDLTLDKEFITKNKTTLPLLRGNNVSEFSYTLGEYFTDEEFTKKSSLKGKYIPKERIVCQQISNIHLEKRLKFAKIPGNIVLGNSCNFLTFNETLFGDNEVSLDYLLGILNSLLLNWRFKVTNSNNHISNYELAELPIVVPTANEKGEIENLVTSVKKDKNPNDMYEINMKVFDLYKITEEERAYILGKHEKILSSTFTIQQNSLFNYANI